MKNFLQLLIGLLIIIIIGTGCQNNIIDAEEHNANKIYTSIYPIQYITEELVGEFADVETVYPPGVDAHTYEPSTKDMIDISGGDAFIYLGAGMESFAETTADALKSSGVQFLELGEHESLFLDADEHDDENDDHGHDHGDFDPHIWFDPLRMIDMSDLIKDEMIHLFPEEEALIEENYRIITNELADLDTLYTNTLATKTNKKMIVSHAAYGYWEERYGIKQIPISGISVTDEPSQKELAYLIEQANKENVQYIFFEQNTSNKIAKIIQDHIDATPLYIHNLEVLMDEDLEANKNYISIMKSNLDALDKGLQ